MPDGFHTVSVKPHVHAALRSESRRLGVPIHELTGLWSEEWDSLSDDERWERIREYRERQQQRLAAS